MCDYCVPESFRRELEEGGSHELFKRVTGLEDSIDYEFKDPLTPEEREELDDRIVRAINAELP